MKNHNHNSQVHILAVIVLLILGILAIKSYEDHTPEGRSRKAKREFDRQAKMLKKEIYDKYDVVKDKAEDVIDTVKDKADDIKSQF